VHGQHRLRSGQVEQVDVALQRLRMVPEALAAEVFFAELQALDEGARGAVEDHDPGVHQGAQPFFGCPGCRAHVAF